MALLTRITIAPNLSFDALAAGDVGAPLVLLPHGFAESMRSSAIAQAFPYCMKCSSFSP